MRHIRLRILLQMKLTWLPGNTSKDSQASSSETSVIIAGDQLHASQSAFFQVFQESASVDLVLAQ
jgi:hypothetical protein